jgi:hypothetical protein
VQTFYYFGGSLTIHASDPNDQRITEDSPEIEHVRATWTPEAHRRYRWPSDETSGPGCVFTPDGAGGGKLEFKSPTTMRWKAIHKQPHGA